MNSSMLAWLEGAGRDVRFSFRALRRAKGFSAVVIVTLALCSGANTTVLAVLYGLIVKPLPFRDAGQLVEVYNAFPKNDQPKRPTSVAQYLDYQAHADLFDGFALWRVWTFNFGEDVDPVRGIGARVTADYFRLLGVQPLLGRFFTLEESVPGKDAVIVLTQTFWENHYRANPAIVGTTIRLGGQPFTIIGVAPRELEALNADATMLKPFEWQPAEAAPQARLGLNAVMYARVKPAQPREAALAQLATLEERFYAGAPAGFTDHREKSGHQVRLGQVRAEQTKKVKTSLLLLQGGALFVLLLGCVNVAALVLARANARRAELAIKQALGAGRGTLARQWLSEALLLATAGAAAGLVLTWTSLRVINLYTTQIVREVQPIALDGPLLGLTLAGAMGVAGLITLLPVVRIGRADLLSGMQSGARGASGSAGMRAVSGLLVTVQVALAVVLLVGAGLLLRSFARVMAVDPGFDARRIVYGRVALNAAHNTEAKAQGVLDQVLEKMRALPGVEAVSFSSYSPINELFSPMLLPLRGATGPGDAAPTAAVFGASPEYFATMGIRVLEGRAFTAADYRPEARRVFVVDRTFAQKFFPGRSAVGECFAFGPADQKPEQWPMIVGVVENVKFSGLDDRSGLPLVYGLMRAQGGFSIELRTARPAAEIIPLMRAQVRSVDPTLPLYHEGTVQMQIERLLNNRRGILWLLGSFAAIALLLSAVGIYGMLAYDVTQRTREIGIRGAIGATRGQIVKLIFRQGLGKTAVGLVAGLLGAGLVSRTLQSLLFEISPGDLLTYAGVAGLLLGIAALASWLPARRAAAVDPVIALRGD